MFSPPQQNTYKVFLEVILKVLALWYCNFTPNIILKMFVLW